MKLCSVTLTENEYKQNILSIISSVPMRIIINNAIYDITTFINEHPGGPEVFRAHLTRSATGGGGLRALFFLTA